MSSMSKNPRTIESEVLHLAPVSPLLEDPNWIAGFRTWIERLLELAEELQDNDQVPGFPTGLQLQKLRGNLEFLRMHLHQVVIDSNARGFVVCAPSDEVHTAYQTACGMMDEVADQQSQGRTAIPLKSLESIHSRLALINISRQEEPDSLSQPADLCAEISANKVSDHPGPGAMKAYLSWRSGLRQKVIADELGTSQPTVSRMINKVKKWQANGNRIPGLDDLPKRPFRTYTTDPQKMARCTPVSCDEDDYEDRIEHTIIHP